MSAQAVLNYGMKCIGTVEIVGDRFCIHLENEKSADIERCIYAFVIGDEILRIGSSKGKLRTRLQAWQSDVSNALANKKFRTPAQEAAIWRSALAQHKIGRLYAREGTVAVTPIGELNLYLAEESTLIGRHQPRCCNDVSRHKRRP